MINEILSKYVKFIDCEGWKEALKYPDWYIKEPVATDLKKFNGDVFFRLNFYNLIKELLCDNLIALDREGPTFFHEREIEREITNIVIHHTKTEPEISKEYLSVMGFLNVYVAEYSRCHNSLHRLFYGKPICSGHFDKNNKQIFYNYHWIIRPDGSRERLLQDHQIGLHAGNKAVNRTSIAICFAGDYSNSPPAFSAIESAARIIKQYSNIKNIIGHCEAREGTDCPGNWWNSSTLRGKLIALATLCK